MIKLYHKIDDEFGLKRGMGGGGQQGGMVLKLSGDRKMMEVIDSVDTAKETFEVLAEIEEIRKGGGNAPKR